ncbi:PREDICTED: regulation of nuclear pre-mRNA domain-containing protein 1B [Nicrophorus vespilloides]|uniref:Regulation of nuclear pre-mRNA domain-containing protein 1B n=1 Tax=Nicrophorus vespilloides TaxID=110193 RepID=A0ABM1MWU7_NICVS|nr:PREDICTED: regulation of nuclear pre-mRNA domain-containing protein 1B [Nicrophorus vespilloides]
MSGFTESALIKKLADLNNSSQSIQTLSLWLIHHRKHYAQIVKIWLRELIKAKESKKLIMMYLANDVIQNSRKKGPEFGKEFCMMLSKAFEHMADINADEKTKGSLCRLLNIWKERGVYSEQQITEYKEALMVTEEPPLKKSKKSLIKSESPTDRKKVEKENEVTLEVEAKLDTHVHLSPGTPAGDPPEPEELIKAITDLENNTASTDEVVRQRIAQLPVEVTEISHLSKIEDKDSAEKLSKKIDDAITLINEYNTRLALEVENRKKVSTMLRDFLISQKELLAQAELSLGEYQDKLQKAYIVRQELKSHIQNLPDLTALPDVTGGLPPLPSAGDLFNVNLHNMH